MVLRLHSSQPPIPGIKRHNETDIWRAASTQGIAPTLLYAGQLAEFLVSTYVKTNLPARPQNNEAVLARVFDLLEHCHKLRVNAASINYSRHVSQYWQTIEDKGQISNPALVKKREPMRLLLEALLESDARTGLCHHDPVVANFVGNPDKLYLIDWEFAARGLLVMDYAALCIEWGIDDATIVKRTNIDGDLLSMAKALYEYLCALWAETSA